MPEPNRNQIRRRLAFAAGLLALVAVVAFALTRRPASEAPPTPSGPRPLVVDTQPLPLPPPPLSRADLIAAAGRAASAAAAGKAPPAEDAGLVGRQFRLAIPFGCEGPSQSGAASWSRDEQRGTIKLTARAETWTDETWVRALAGDADIEAIEGFWLLRPWLLAGDCPAAAQTTTPPAQELGLAMFFDADSSRVRRRGERPYEHVMNAPADPAALARGFRLTLAGRITGYGGKDPVRCRADDPNRRPVCLFAVSFERVAFEDPATGDVLAEWRSN